MNGGMVAVAGALPMEIDGLRRLGGLRRTPARGFGYYAGDIRGRDVAFFVSGVGEERAYQTARAACRALPIRAYLSVGLSASLSEDLEPGGLVVAESIASLANGMVYQSDERLLGLARESLEGRASFGLVAASREVLTTSEGKKKAAASCKALALDMETYGAARAVEEQGVPFMAIRAISDTLGEDLPVDFNRFLRGGTLDWPRFMAHVITHPVAIPGLIRLGRNSRMAVRNLTEAVAGVISKM